MKINEKSPAFQPGSFGFRNRSRRLAARADALYLPAMPYARLTRPVHFNAALRYYRPEWDEAENRRVLGACANPHGHGHNNPITENVLRLCWPRLLAGLPERVNLVSLRLHEDATFCVEYFGDSAE